MIFRDFFGSHQEWYIQLNNKKKQTRSYWLNRLACVYSTTLQDADWLKFYIVNTIVNRLYWWNYSSISHPCICGLVVEHYVDPQAKGSSTVCSPIKAKWQLSLQLRYLHFFWPRHSIEQAILRFEVNFWNSKSKIVVTTKDLIFFKVGFAFFQITIMSLGFQPCDLD